jgi:hypothetical protein
MVLRLALCSAVLILLTSLATGQDQKPPPEAERVRQILDDARAAPAEIFADVVFRLLDRSKIATSERAVLLEEVFQRAGEAREALPLQFATAGSPKGRASPAAGAHNLKLDSLSIRSRVLQPLLGIDPEMARKLYEEMPALESPKPGCEAQFVPNPAVYFETLAAVVQRVPFTQQEKVKGEPLWWVERSIGSMTTSAEVLAAARFFPALAHTEAEALRLATALTTSLNIADSDRGFTTFAARGELVKVVLAANEKLHGLGSPQTPLPMALRAFLVRQFGGARCKLGTEDGGEAAIKVFNDAVRGWGTIPLISPEEVKPTRAEGEAAGADYANEAAFQSLFSEVKALTKADKSVSIALTRTTADWGFQARQLLGRIQDLDGALNQDRLEVFHQKMQLLFTLFDIAPSGDISTVTLKGMVALLSDPDILRRAPAEWLYEADRLITYTHIFTPEAVAALQGLENKIPGFAFETGLEISVPLTDSGLGALSLYGRLAALTANAQP